MFRACVIGTIIYILLFCHYLQFFCNKNIILCDCLTLFFPGCWRKRLSLVKKSFSNKYDVILTLFRKVIYKPNLHIHYDTIQVKGPGGAPTQWLPDWHMFGGSQWQDVHTSSYAPGCPCLLLMKIQKLSMILKLKNWLIDSRLKQGSVSILSYSNLRLLYYILSIIHDSTVTAQ